jgi:hypothetical protein
MLGLAVTMSSPSAASAATCQYIGMPAYFAPGPTWRQVSSAYPTVRYLILNPASGPGLEADPGYAAMVSHAQDEGVEVLGYVDTEYASRPLDVVQAEIDQFHSWYDVDGIFLDRTSADASDLVYYIRIARHVHSDLDGTFVINPGSYPNELYVRLADAVVTFEGDAETYLQTSAPSWVKDYPASSFWHLIYSTSEERLPQVLELSRSNRAGTVYVTDRGLPNPWGMPASYWETERAAVAQTARGCYPRPRWWGGG